MQEGLQEKELMEVMETPEGMKASKRRKVTFVDYDVMECRDVGPRVLGTTQMMSEMHKQMMTGMHMQMMSKMSKQIMSEMLKHVSSEVNGLKDVVNMGIKKQIKIEENMDNMRGISAIDDKISVENFVTLCKGVAKIRDNIVRFKSLEQKMSALTEIRNVLHKIPKKIEDECANITDKLNRFICNKFGDSSPPRDRSTSLFESDDDLPSETYKTPYTQSKTKNVSDYRAQMKAKLVENPFDSERDISQAHKDFQNGNKFKTVRT
ncbi:hypothetical protein V6N13_072383 [Hibiscus sabdariffa]